MRAPRLSIVLFSWMMHPQGSNRARPLLRRATLRHFPGRSESCSLPPAPRSTHVLSPDCGSLAFASCNRRPRLPRDPLRGPLEASFTVASSRGHSFVKAPPYLYAQVRNLVLYALSRTESFATSPIQSRGWARNQATVCSKPPSRPVSGFHPKTAAALDASTTMRCSSPGRAGA
jgi:hypothetical protein